MPVFTQKKVLASDRYKEYLQLMAVFHGLDISDRQIEIMDAFYWESRGMITPEARKKVAKELGMTVFNLNNQLSKLREKKVLSEKVTEEDTTWMIIEDLLPNIEADKTDFVTCFQMQS